MLTNLHGKSTLLTLCKVYVNKHEHGAINLGHLVPGKIAALSEEHQRWLWLWVWRAEDAGTGQDGADTAEGPGSDESQPPRGL